MRLSICMMIKNEGKHLDSCLKSITPILKNVNSELIIVDTGSTDESIEIARKYTDKLYFHEWNNDFSAMRNIAISYCIGEWIFILDGDEVVEEYSEIIHFFKGKTYKQYKSATMVVKNLMSLENESSYSTVISHRFFKKDKEFKYVGAVHNQPIYKEPTYSLNASMIHYGYIPTDVELMERKFKRTTSILKGELNKDPKNIYYTFQLSVSYAMHKDYKESLEYAKKAYDLLRYEKNRYVYRYVYHQYALVLVQNSLWNMAEKVCLEGINVTNKATIDKIDMYYYLSIAQINLNKRDEAIESLKQYFYYLTMLKNGEMKNDTSIVLYNLHKEEECNIEISKLLNLSQRENESIEYLKNLSSKQSIMRYSGVLIKNSINSKDILGLKEYYENTFKIKCSDNINKFFNTIEAEKENKDIETIKELEGCFAGQDSCYEIFNTIRMKFYEKPESVTKDIYDFIKKYPLNKREDYYGELIYMLLSNGEDIMPILQENSYAMLHDIFTHLKKRFKDFKNELFKLMEEKYDENNYDIKYLGIMKFLLRYILIIDNISINNNLYKEIFNKYLYLGNVYLHEIYNELAIEKELLAFTENKNVEERFFMYMYKALKEKETDKEAYIEYLQKAFKAYPAMKRGIELFVQEVEDNK